MAATGSLHTFGQLLLSRTHLFLGGGEMAVNFFGKSAPLSFLLGDCTPFLGLARSGGDKPAIALLRPDNPRRYEGEPPRL